jgi:hypothetical protein
MLVNGAFEIDQGPAPMMRRRASRRRPLICINLLGPTRATFAAIVLKDRLFIALTVLAMLGAVALTGVVLFSG